MSTPEALILASVIGAVPATGSVIVTYVLGRNHRRRIEAQIEATTCPPPTP